MPEREYSRRDILLGILLVLLIPFAVAAVIFAGGWVGHLIFDLGRNGWEAF